MRCYTPTEGELALNQYQFQEEMDTFRRQQAMLQMDEAQYDRMRLENQGEVRNLP